MSNLSVIIPSKNIDNLIPCLKAIYSHEPEARVIWVDDRNQDIEVHADVAYPSGGKFLIVPGEKPFVFARNVNLGIKAAGEDDVILLNDDALLETPGGFTAMQRSSEKYPEIGVIAASCNQVGNPNQRRRHADGLREEDRMVCFVCVLIPRRTLDKIGLLDERFSGYGMDDDDYCFRVRRAGLLLAIHDGCYVEHGKLSSSFRGDHGADFRPNLRRFVEKWGVDNWNCGKETSQFPECFPD